MTRYTLRRETLAGANTVKTSNPGEVERWLWDALAQRSTTMVTVSMEDVLAPGPKPECEGQRSIMDELNNVYDPAHDSWVVAP